MGVSPKIDFGCGKDRTVVSCFDTETGLAFFVDLTVTDLLSPSLETAARAIRGVMRAMGIRVNQPRQRHARLRQMLRAEAMVTKGRNLHD